MENHLYIVTIKFGYDYSKEEKFFIVTDNPKNAEQLALDKFPYDYGSKYVSSITVIATEGKHGIPNTLIIGELKK
ncbi:MAG: hypothetical protein M0R03_15615 [Novosphingobium sp.]|nr:hypothetical protein [Novosphingobium sp.]